MAWRDWRQAAGLFLVSRLGVLGLAWLGLQFISAVISNPFLDAWRYYGSGYVALAQGGYSALTPQEVPIFPLYPLLMRTLSPVTGGDYALAGFLLSQACILASLGLLMRLVREEWDPVVSWRSAVLLAVSPCSVYLSAVSPEALLLATTLGAFLLAQQGRWLVAALPSSLAGATHPAGLLVPLGLLLVYSRSLRSALTLPLGWFLPALHGLALSGYPDHAQGLAHLFAAWPPWPPMGALLASPSQLLSGDFQPLAWLRALGFLVSLALGALVFVRLGRTWGTWTALNLLLGWAQAPGQGLAVTFPLVIGLARVLPETVFNVVVYLSTLLLGLATLVYTHPGQSP